MEVTQQPKVKQNLFLDEGRPENIFTGLFGNFPQMANLNWYNLHHFKFEHLKEAQQTIGQRCEGDETFSYGI